MKVALVTLITAGVMAVSGSPAQGSGSGSEVPRCKYEDSKGCVWDAKHMGNGKGQSFRVFKGGKVRYITHARAHELGGF
jgi:hypothetical protein